MWRGQPASACRVSVICEENQLHTLKRAFKYLVFPLDWQRPGDGEGTEGEQPRGVERRTAPGARGWGGCNFKSRCLLSRQLTCVSKGFLFQQGSAVFGA